MRTTLILAICLWMCFFFGYPLNAQIIYCGPDVAVDTGGYVGTGFFNYGSSARIKSNTYKSAVAVGQPFIGYTENVYRNSTLGFYARYYLPPFPLKVKATQGELLDRIQITWKVDQLGPSASEGFNLYRDGIFLAHLDAEIHSYNDFNVIAGRAYVYCVEGINIFGSSVCTEAIGFQVPNGVVTGWISTFNGTPVVDATVTLTPMQGFSAKFANGDGALALADSLNPFLPALDSNWTITFWIKTDTAGNTPGKLIGMPGMPGMPGLYIRSRPNTGGQNGIALATTAGGAALLALNFPNTPDAWHHVALTYDGNGNKGRLYFDGSLVGTTTLDPVASPDTLQLGEAAGPGLWVGRLDELRIYHRKLDELDFDMVMEGTASSETPYLTHYWKMDEELGTRSYDIVKRHILYLCGAIFDADRPPVHTAGITNEDGYYRIESASYGTGTTFLAKPKKNFYLHRSLKFERSENDYATLPDFRMTKKATIEVWVSNAAPAGIQTIISKVIGPTGQEFGVYLNETPDGLDNTILVLFNGYLQAFGTLGQGSDFKHLAITWDSTTTKFNVFKNGVKFNQPNNTFPALITNWSNPANPWFLGGGGTGVYFDGLIDEVAVYDTTLSAATILSHYQNARDIHERGLRVYFPLDEGSGTKVNNTGSMLLTGGTTFGTEWSPLAVHQVITPHEFAPSTRQVSLNPSVTSVDQVDFIDRSTVAVVGYVRYKNTDCFAKNVEILVNGESYIPKVMTDSFGRFVVDFDPGTSALLTPKFEDHTFIPASWEISNISSPIAGLLFTDVKTHQISGQISGGECRKSIIKRVGPIAGRTTCIVKVSSFDQCYQRQITLLDSSGVFVFNDLPPLEKMTIAIITHSNDDIKKAFDAAGGSVVDISKRDTIIDFIYHAQPNIVITQGLEPYDDDCDLIVLEQGTPAIVKIKLVEHYYGGDCEIDTAAFQIINGFADETVDTAMSNGLLVYHFDNGVPNPTPPYLKIFEVVATTLDGNDCEFVTQGLVTGIRAKDQTFTTLLPEIPELVLRDPPGDGSYSFLEKEEKFCTTHEVIDDFEGGIDGGVTVLIGGEEKFLITALGEGVEIDVANQFNLGINTRITYSRLSNHSFETCTSYSSRISTSPGDLVVGGYQGGDLYMGSAINIKYGNVDIVSFDTMNCVGMNEEAVEVQPGDFATTFMYSEFYIKNILFPSLEDLANDPEAESADVVRYQESIERWHTILDNNEEQKARARFLKNISYDAGVEYEYAETSDTTTADEITNLANVEIEGGLDFEVSVEELGIAGKIHVVTNTSNGGKDIYGSSKGITTGYHLSDDDPLDAYSIDVGLDSAYKTPVFNIKAGQTSCPWEFGTAKRQGMLLTSVDGPVRTDVPANEAASFEFDFGNISATNETFTYAFTAGPESNPYGAEIFCNGAPMNQIQWYAIPYGTSFPVTVTVERGPVEYDYDSLEIVLYSACEDQRANDLGILPDTLKNLYSAVYVSVHFIRPCSEVDINVPQQDWVIFPDPLTPENQVDDNVLRISVSGYDTTETDFKLIRLQFRRSDGDGAWINIPDSVRYNPKWFDFDNLPGNPPLLAHIHTEFIWNTGGLADGPYEIRAVAVCTGDVSDKPGFSKVIKGRIDRKPPSLVGLPQPSDGVFQVGDEISFTFNQDINCNKLIQADIDSFNNVGLYDATTDELIDANITCVDNKIVIEPNFQNEFFENHILRAELHYIQDLTGNIDTFEKWEFYVDRNELAWLTDSAGITKYEDETKTITVKIHNRGGYPVPFTIPDVPDWVHVSPDAGTLVANEIREIQFTATDSLSLGTFETDTMKLFTETGQNPFFMGGTEFLPFTVRNICRPPDWVVNTGLYQLTMTMNIRVQVNNTFSIDPEDQVAVFISGQLRGTAKLAKVISTGNYIAFVTVYGNSADIGKSLTYELFDASACLHYPGTLSGAAVTFQSNAVIGAPNAARVLSATSNLVLQEIPVKTGWNWISFNLGFNPSTINSVLNKYTNQASDLVKDQTAFATYTNGLWSGTLANITNTTAYQYQANQNNIIKVVGSPLTPASVPIPVVAGWNWIGYIPTYKLPVNTALASLTASTNDVIKSQTAFAQYLSPGAGWVGNLKTMQPNQGYLLYLNTGGTITYPPQPPFTGVEHFSSRDAESLLTYWHVDASEYEHNMTFIGIFQYDETNATTEDMELGAFVGDEMRGVGEAIYIEYLDAYMFFMTCFANTNGEQLHFKLYDGTTGTIQNLHEKMDFIPNYHQGSVEYPLPFTLQTTGIGEVDNELSFNVQPNPFRDETACLIELPEAQDVRLIVTDMDGKVLYNTQIQANAGMNTFIWKGSSTKGAPLSNGVYFIRMETEQGFLTKKVVIQR